MCKMCYNCGAPVTKGNLYCPQCGYKQSQSNILYHYTTLETAVKILSNLVDKNKIVLRAGKFDSMNDPNDSVYFIKELEKQYPNYTIDEKAMYREGVPYFVAFSPLQDDLHMWNCYGDNGKGVAIGIDRDTLYRIQYRNINRTPEIPRLYKCHYLKDQEIVRFLERHEIDANSLEKLSDRELWHISYIVKHPCYRYEMEERLLVPSIDASNRKQNNKPLEDYLELKIPITAIKEIVLGPMLTSTSEFFDRFGNIIKKSTIPYVNK